MYKYTEMKLHRGREMQQHHMLEWMLLGHICFE